MKLNNDHIRKTKKTQAIKKCMLGTKSTVEACTKNLVPFSKINEKIRDVVKVLRLEQYYTIYAQNSWENKLLLKMTNMS